jgi:hypothetical protein
MSSSKVLASVFWDKDGMFLVDYPDAAIMANCYIALLAKLKQPLAPKCQGKLSKGILFLQDNTAPHKVVIMYQFPNSHTRFSPYHGVVLQSTPLPALASQHTIC